jgi:hypothetical protein
MKRLVLVLFAALAVAASLPAQQASYLNFNGVVPPILNSPEAGAFNFPLEPALSLPARALSVPSFSAIPRAALPDVPGVPQYGRSGDFGYRWDLATGYEYVHFKSAPFSANLSGIHTALAYSLNECSVVAAFGGDIFAAGEMSKFVLLSGGGRVFWNRQPRRWSPWTHALIGVAHVNPQVAGVGKNGFALQVGGGVDWLLNPRLSFRGEADYVRTQLYSESQNNLQAGVGVVLHF